jgi:hypothetical protein
MRPVTRTTHPDSRSIPTGTALSVLIAVDEELGEGASFRVAPELADPVGSLEVGERQDAEELGSVD